MRDSDDTEQFDDQTRRLYEGLEPFEPYTTAELAERHEEESGVIRRLLDRLFDAGAVRKKEPRSGTTIWMREPPVESCSACGREFEIRYLHPVFSAARYCPRCGNQLS